ncbi:MAG: hypothetical protein ACYDHP_07935 [Ferrimicrobium sp.]
MSLAGRGKSRGNVEVDRTAIGTKKSNQRGRSTASKTEVGIAVKVKQPKGFETRTIARLPDESAKNLGELLDATLPKRWP